MQSRNPIQNPGRLETDFARPVPPHPRGRRIREEPESPEPHPPLQLQWMRPHPLTPGLFRGDSRGSCIGRSISGETDERQPGRRG